MDEHLKAVVANMNEFREMVRECRLRQIREANRRLLVVDARAEEQRLRRAFEVACRSRLDAAESEIARGHQDLISRGLGNTTLVANVRATEIERAKQDIETLNRELSEALELQATRLAMAEIETTPGGGS